MNREYCRVSKFRKTSYHIMLDNLASIHCNPLGSVKVKYMNNYMLKIAKNLRSFDHLDILHVDAQMPSLHNL